MVKLTQKELKLVLVELFRRAAEDAAGECIKFLTKQLNFLAKSFVLFDELFDLVFVHASLDNEAMNRLKIDEEKSYSSRSYQGRNRAPFRSTPSVSMDSASGVSESRF